jgi:uncharacterized protein (TIGR03067 family)
MVTLYSVLLVCVIVCPAPFDEKEALKQLQGTWRVVSLKMEGQHQTPEKPPKSITVVGNKLNGMGSQLVITLDASKKPKWLDLTEIGQGREPVRGIYEVEGDTLRLCFSLLPGQESNRPSGFETKNKNTGVTNFKRAK